jgi:hypothetical protein
MGHRPYIVIVPPADIRRCRSSEQRAEQCHPDDEQDETSPVQDIWATSGAKCSSTYIGGSLFFATSGAPSRRESNLLERPRDGILADGSRVIAASTAHRAWRANVSSRFVTEATSRPVCGPQRGAEERRGPFRARASW